MVFDSFFDFVFGPVLALPTFWAVLIMSLLISLIITIIYKYTTNQNLMKEMKDEIKELQKEAKELKDKPAEMMKANKKMMETNMKYMKHSLKPTLITFIPIILIFGWMSSHFAYESIRPQQDFSVSAIFQKNTNGNAEIIAPDGTTLIDGKVKKIENDKATWNLKGAEGEHTLEFSYNGETQQKNVLITNGESYIEPSKKTSGTIKSVQINYKPKKIVNLFGWKIGWLGTYILSSIIFTTSLRKLLKVY